MCVLVLVESGAEEVLCQYSYISLAFPQWGILWQDQGWRWFWANFMDIHVSGFVGGFFRIILHNKTILILAISLKFKQARHLQNLEHLIGDFQQLWLENILLCLWQWLGMRPMKELPWSPASPAGCCVTKMSIKLLSLLSAVNGVLFSQWSVSCQFPSTGPSINWF